MPLPSRTAKIGEGILVPSGGTWNTTSTPTSEPMRTRLANPKNFETLVTGPEPFVVEYRNHADASPVTSPLATVTAQGRHHGLVVPDGAFYVKHFGGGARPADMCKPVDQPLGTITTSDHHGLVVPYRNASARPADQPMHTLATRDSAALVSHAVEIEDCFMRMLAPREHLGAQRFPSTPTSCTATRASRPRRRETPCPSTPPASSAPAWPRCCERGPPRTISPRTRDTR